MLLVISSYFLYVPVDPDTVEPSTQVSISYFLFWYLAFYLSYTFLNIPHLAQGSDLSSNAKAKNTLFGMRAAMGYVGLLLFFVIPLLPGFDTTEFTPETLQWAAMGGVVLMLPALYLHSTYLPGGKKRGVIQGQTKAAKKSRLTLRQVLNNKPLLIFLGSYLLYGISHGMFWSMSFIFVNSYLDIGKHYALAALLSYIAGIVSLRFWTSLASRFNKKNIWGLGASLNAIGLLMIVILEPGEASTMALFFIFIIMGCGISAGEAIAPSALSDIVDYHLWKFRADCSASLFSLYQLSIKITFALGGAIALFIAGWYGFDPADKVHLLDSIYGLRIAISWMPAISAFLAIFFILRLPISARRHAAIRRRLDKTAIHSNVKKISY